MTKSSLTKIYIYEIGINHVKSYYHINKASSKPILFSPKIFISRVTLDQSRKSFDKFIGCLINEGKELDAITLLYPVLLLNVVILFAEG